MKIQVTRDNTGKLIAANDADQIHFSRWKNDLNELEPGEIRTLDVQVRASLKLNAWHHILMGEIFKGQETFTDVKAFRGFAYMMAGYASDFECAGKVERVANSWAFDAEPDDLKRSEIHDKVIAALHEPDIVKTLWPHVSVAAGTETLLALIAHAEAAREAYKAAKAAKQRKQKPAANDPVQSRKKETVAA